MNKRTCTFDGCDKRYEAGGYCIAHYRQLWRGKPLTSLRVTISPSERLDMHTDKTGDCWIWTGTRNAKGYGQININHKMVGAHRVAYELAYGPIHNGLQIDHHRCYNHACVNPAHLRACTNKQNQENRAGATVNSKSGVRGVCWNRSASKWRGKVTHNGKDIFVGYFATIEGAEAAVITKRNELFTHNDADQAS